MVLWSLSMSVGIEWLALLWAGPAPNLADRVPHLKIGTRFQNEKIFKTNKKCIFKVVHYFWAKNVILVRIYCNPGRGPQEIHKLFHCFPKSQINSIYFLFLFCFLIKLNYRCVVPTFWNGCVTQRPRPFPGIYSDL